MKIAWHLGLGDAIACAAIVAKLATENDVVEIPCWKHNEVSIKSFFVNYPNVKITTINIGEDKEWAKNADIKLGVYDVKNWKYHTTHPHEDFVQWFYRQARMDMNEKDKYCPIKKYAEQYFIVKNKIPLQFIHDDQSRNFYIEKHLVSDINTYKPENNGQGILIHIGHIMAATEIHCIDSSFLHLVECLPTTGKLFYHKYARPNSPDYKYLKKDWTIIN